MEGRLASLDGKKTRGWSSMQRALIQALLNDRYEALELMAQAMSEGHGYYGWLHSHPALANLRGWPPYEAFMRPR